MKKSIYKNAFFKSILSISNIAIPLLVTPYVYRVLDPDLIGEIEYGNSLYIYFFVFGSLGIYGYGLREISKVRNKPELVSELYHNLFSIGLISNLLAVILLLIFSFVGIHAGGIQNILLILSIGLISNALYTEWINEAFEEFFFITIKTIVIRILSVVAIFVYITKRGDIYLYLSITVLVTFFNNLASFIYALKHTKFSFNFYNIEWRKYLPPLFFIFILNNSNVLYTTLDKTMLGVYSSVEAVAFFSIGQKIMEIVRAILMTTIFVSMPRLSFYLETDYSRYNSALISLSRLTMFIAIPATVGLFLLSKEIVLLFAGVKYSSAIIPTQLFSFRIFVLALESLIAQQILFLHGKEKVILSYNIIYGLFNFILIFLFRKNINPSLAITITTLAELFLVFTEMIYVNKHLKINIKKLVQPSLLYLGATLFFIPIVISIRFFTSNILYSFFLSVIFCLLFYSGTMLIIKETLAIQFYSKFKNLLK